MQHEYNSPVEELLDIKDAIRTLADRALNIVRQHDKFEYDRAKSYWYAHIIMALDDDHDYLGNSMSTIESSIEAIESKIYDADDDEEDDE